MGILVANDGKQFVNTIADRDAIAKRHSGMQVTVRDATADPQFGAGMAVYIWDSVTSEWLPTYASVKSELTFSTEEKVLANGQVTTDFVVKDSLVWSAKVLDADDTILGDAKVTVNGATLSIGTTEFDGNRLHFTYAHGKMTAEMQTIWDSKVGVESPEFVGQPKAPTATVGDESEVLANTAFVAETLKSAGFVKEDEGWVPPEVELDTYTLAVVDTTSTLDLAEQQVFTIAANANRTLAFSNAPGAGRTMTVVIKLTGNSGTINWPAGIQWNGGNAPELGETYTVVVLFWDGITWVGSVGSSD